MTDDLERATGEPTSDTAEPLDVIDAADAMTDDASAEESAPAIVPGNAGDASLLGLIDRLGGLLERSDLSEIEVEVGGTALVLRKPAAVAQAFGATAVAEAPAAASPVPASSPVAPAAEAPGAPVRPAIAAPLTGIWYASPAPGSAPFVEVGREVAVGQVVGLIEAMKLFNEIKSDLAGRVVRVVPESGTLVKAKQPLIEVEPL